MVYYVSGLPEDVILYLFATSLMVMANLMHHIRKNEHPIAGRVVLFLWIISAANIFLFSEATILQKEQPDKVTIHSPITKESLMEGIDLDLAVNVEDAPDLVEFITPRYFSLRILLSGGKLPFITLRTSLLRAVLERVTPPPWIS